MNHLNGKAPWLQIISWALRLQTHTPNHPERFSKNITSYFHSQQALTAGRAGKCGERTFWKASRFHSCSLNARQTGDVHPVKTPLLPFWNWNFSSVQFKKPFISLLQVSFPPCSIAREIHTRGREAPRLEQRWASLSHSFMQHTSSNIQMDVTAPAEHIRPVIHVFQLLSNFISDKGAKSF